MWATMEKKAQRLILILRLYSLAWHRGWSFASIENSINRILKYHWQRQRRTLLYFSPMHVLSLTPTLPGRMAFKMGSVSEFLICPSLRWRVRSLFSRVSSELSGVPDIVSHSRIQPTTIVSCHWVNDSSVWDVKVLKVTLYAHFHQIIKQTVLVVVEVGSGGWTRTEWMTR